jgi:hypothetical protein
MVTARRCPAGVRRGATVRPDSASDDPRRTGRYYVQ